MATTFLGHYIHDSDAVNTTTQHVFGYPGRALPCTNDTRTCEYLSAVYKMHRRSMLYTWIFWEVLLGIAVICFTLRCLYGYDGRKPPRVLDACSEKAGYVRRRWLLPDAPCRWLFGSVSRLQLVVLATLSSYLLVFLLVGIIYRTWVTPISGSNLHNTNTGFVGFLDRVGAFAFALTPLAILLASRKSILSLITGIPYNHFTFLHCWTGYIIFFQSFIHTLGWTVVTGRLYQPQPAVYGSFLAQRYVIFGIFAMFFITLLTIGSTKWAIRKLGYNFFKLTHWIIALLFFGACWGHWDRLRCWMVPSLILVFIDQGLRLLSTMYIHLRSQKSGARCFEFKCAEAKVTLLGSPNEGAVLRLYFDYDHRNAGPWRAGQHFYLTFPGISIWQSRPFSPASLPSPSSEKMQHHTYILRVRRGLTARLAEMGDGATVPVILTGPYGNAFPSRSDSERLNVMAVAGGTGITFALPIALAALKEQQQEPKVVELVWTVKRAQCLLWLEAEMGHLKKLLKQHTNFRIRIFITRESERVRNSFQPDSASVNSCSEKVEKDSKTSDDDSSSYSPSMTAPPAHSFLSNQPRFRVEPLAGSRPSMSEVVNEFIERVDEAGGPAEIFGSGPADMNSDLRAAVASIRGRRKLGFYWDARG